MQLHRQDSHFKKCKPARPTAVKLSQKLNAKNAFKGMASAFADAFTVQPSLALAV
jgi:hypothetical protein